MHTLSQVTVTPENSHPEEESATLRCLGLGTPQREGGPRTGKSSSGAPPATYSTMDAPTTTIVSGLEHKETGHLSRT